MRRREFVAGIGSAAAWPLAVRAQQQPKIRHVGIIDDTPQWNAFRSRLRELGYLEGEHIAFDYASGDGNPERLAEAAAQAISRRSIKSALRSYCSSVHYLTTSMEGAMRINLTRRTGRNRDRDRGAVRNGALSCTRRGNRQARQ